MVPCVTYLWSVVGHTLREGTSRGEEQDAKQGTKPLGRALVPPREYTWCEAEHDEMANKMKPFKDARKCTGARESLAAPQDALIIRSEDKSVSP